MTDPKLVETLDALARAVAAATALAGARSAPAVEAATSVADRHLAEVGRLVDGLRSADQRMPAEDQQAPGSWLPGLGLPTVEEAMSNLARNAPKLKAAGSTLFGQPVGDGLDQERAQARTAIDLLRSIVNDHMLPRSNIVGAIEERRGAIVDFGGTAVISGERLKLVLALYEPDHEGG